MRQGGVSRNETFLPDMGSFQSLLKGQGEELKGGKCHGRHNQKRFTRKRS